LALSCASLNPQCCYELDFFQFRQVCQTHDLTKFMVAPTSWEGVMHVQCSKGLHEP